MLLVCASSDAPPRFAGGAEVAKSVEVYESAKGSEGKKGANGADYAGGTGGVGSDVSAKHTYFSFKNQLCQNTLAQHKMV